MMRFTLGRHSLHRLCFGLIALLLALAACSMQPPAGVVPVSPFDIDRYAGKWYEIARLDHGFERGLTDVNATYRRRPDGSVDVVNRGYDFQAGRWREATGTARFVGDPNRGSLKVTFFWPFYGGYHVAALDQRDYRWSLVVGPDRDYAWILSRDKRLTPEIRQELVERAQALGIDTQALIWVTQTRPDA
jgi:apolipoprotein D and lipocalin family protein